MTETLQATIKADPGWYLAWAWLAEHPAETDRLELDPIIAWEIWSADDDGERNSWPVPITLEGRRQHLLGEFLFKTPNGHFFGEDGIIVCRHDTAALKILRHSYETIGAAVRSNEERTRKGAP